jgi:hypothetical protein
MLDKVKNEIFNPSSVLRSGTVSQIASTFTSNFVSSKYPPASAKWLKDNDEGVIQSAYVRRAPISKMIHKALDLITLGKWEKSLTYDKIFHLSLIIQYKIGGQTKQAILEKNERIHFSNTLDNPPNAETIAVSGIAGKQIQGFIANAEKAMGANYFSYSAFSNNCQNFISGLLSANGLLTPKLKEFIVQPIDELLKKQPGYLSNVADTITNVANIANQAVSGGNKNRFITQLQKEGIDPARYLDKAREQAHKAGYNPKLLEFANDNIHKLRYIPQTGPSSLFGRVGYRDFLIWSHRQNLGKNPEGTAEAKKDRFHKSHSKLKGQWKENPFSPNNLALRILW